MNVIAPLCPVHNVPMKPGKYPGKFYCSTFVGIGAAGANAKGFCTASRRAEVPTGRTWEQPPPTAEAAANGTARAPQAAQGDATARFSACLEFVGRLYQGQTEKAEDALAFARRIYQEWP